MLLELSNRLIRQCRSITLSGQQYYFHFLSKIACWLLLSKISFTEYVEYCKLLFSSSSDLVKIRKVSNFYMFSLDLHISDPLHMPNSSQSTMSIMPAPRSLYHDAAPAFTLFPFQLSWARLYHVLFINITFIRHVLFHYFSWVVQIQMI